MIEIRNLLFQPLTFQLAGQRLGLHLGSRQRKLVEDAHVSEEIRTAARRGFVALTALEQPEQPEAQSAAAEETSQTPGGAATTPVGGEAAAGGEPVTALAETADQPQARRRR